MLLLQPLQVHVDYKITAIGNHSHLGAADTDAGSISAQATRTAASGARPMSTSLQRHGTSRKSDGRGPSVGAPFGSGGGPSIASDAVMRCRCKIILSLVQGKAPTMIAKPGLCAKSQVYRAADRFIEHGPVGLADRREDNAEKRVTDTYGAVLLRLIEGLLRSMAIGVLRGHKAYARAPLVHAIGRKTKYLARDEARRPAKIAYRVEACLVRRGIPCPSQPITPNPSSPAPWRCRRRNAKRIWIANARDHALRERLAALLRAHDRAGHVIDRPVNGDPDRTAGYAPTSEQPGTIIAGRYKLLEEIGQGGMGTVWAAEQTTPVRRKVALKLIKAGMDSRSVLARFEAERQALALMDHPNIAKVLDGGLTESGRPYFVMEYVKGVPITEYCDATRLSVEERLDLFIHVCSALQHAHQKGIIHRDLKPSNILVAPYDDKPVPKVIDFGLAKALHQSLTEKTLYTAHEMVLGTPLYMSPEQAQLNNLDVDTRADIYSLGVLLYELLTGTTPLERKRFKEAAWDEIRRMIREEEPPRPSTRLSTTDTLPSLATFRHTEPARLKKLVRGELDWIVMKALEKDRTRRYETASGFARDIQRYLDDEVVEARPPSTGYRIGKFVRRHRRQVIAAGFVVLALLAGISGTTWGLIREARAKTRLAESLDREQKANSDLSAANAKVQARYDLAVDAIKTFHTGVSEDFLLKEDQFKDLRNRLLKSASDFYGKLSGLLGKETDFASRRALAESNFDWPID